MKALVLHGPGAYRVEAEWPEPAVREGWARVRVGHAGICGSDLPRFGTTGSYRHPMILGHEFAGVVETPAPGSRTFRKGEPVAVLPIIPCGACAGCRDYGPFHCTRYRFLGSRDDGGFAEYCLVPETNLFRLPEGVPVRLGAFIEPIAVTLHVVRRSGFSAGSSALVYGAGAIGLLTALWLRAQGARRVTIADVRDESLAIARRLGFDDLVNPRTEGSRLERDYDYAFEAAGSQQALCDAIEHTRPLGTLTVVGRDTGDTVIPLAQFERMMRAELTVRTCWGYDVRGDEEVLRTALRAGWFPIAPLITHEIGLDAAPALIRRMLDRSVFYCKVLIKMETGA